MTARRVLAFARFAGTGRLAAFLEARFVEALTRRFGALDLFFFAGFLPFFDARERVGFFAMGGLHALGFAGSQALTKRP